MILATASGFLMAIRHHLKADHGKSSGFSWRRDFDMWHKPIVRPDEDPHNIPPSRAVAIRLDAENRVQKLADALKHHAADPVGYADQVRQEREHAAHGQAIPD